jgi:cytochrome c peroxidase
MNPRRSAILAVAVAFMLWSLHVFFAIRTGRVSPEPQTADAGLGSVETLLARYREWEASYLRAGGDRNLAVALGSVKGLSTRHADGARGHANLNLIDREMSVEIEAMPAGADWAVWLIVNRPGPGRSVAPEPGDVMLRVGVLKRSGQIGTLRARLDEEISKTADPDLIVVTEAAASPVVDRVLVGMPSLFQRLRRSAERGQVGVLEQPPASGDSWMKSLANTVMPTAHAQIGPIPNPSTPLEQLITAGRQIFFNQTFNGNGRTCGTCHRENNNLTIDPEFIATLPPNDPLFVAEFVPALSQNFENPVLMRKFGLILVNADGFGDLANNFVMRGVPHISALLQNTLTPVSGGADGANIPPNERLGWSGDAAPGLGTLREILVGMIVQHFPKTLNRASGVDFRLPTDTELDAVEAFQRSIGRQADLDLNSLRLKSEVADLGRRIFLNTTPALGLGGNPNVAAGNCNLCHVNAGASDFFFPGENANFNTNVEGLPSQPADNLIPAQKNPPDGGFGTTGVSPTGGIGNGSFNTPVLVEAADTGPFFHNNSISTIEGAVAFYNSDAFNQPPGFGSLIPGGMMHLQPTDVEAVATFLRVINALENIQSSMDLENRAKTAPISAQARELLRLSISELEDAIEVLHGAGLHADAQARLRSALAFDWAALASPSYRNAFIDQALAQKAAARAIMSSGSP